MTTSDLPALVAAYRAAPTGTRAEDEALFNLVTAYLAATPAEQAALGLSWDEFMDGLGDLSDRPKTYGLAEEVAEACRLRGS